MNTTNFARGMLLASLICASSAYAGDIRKCVSSDGQVTLTDDACPGGTRLNKVITTADTPAPAAEPVLVTTLTPRADTSERFILNRIPVRYVNVAKTRNPANGLSLDSETLRTARMHMRMSDTLRGQRVASLQ